MAFLELDIRTLLRALVLGNLVAIVDRNGLQIDGAVCDVCHTGDIGRKFEAFGWDVRYANGHDIDALVALFEELKSERGGVPHLVVADTVKGKGVSFMEDQVGWHGKAPNDEQYEQAMAELGKAGDEL